MRRYVIASCLLLLASTVSFAEETTFSLALERSRIAPGKQTQLTMTFTGTPDLPAPALPFIPGLETRYQKSERRPVGSDGASRETLVHTYRVIAMKAGTYRFGPLSFEHGGVVYTSNAVDLEVTKEAALAERAAVATEAKADLSRRIYLRLEYPRSRIYANERLPLSIKLMSDWLDLEDVTVPAVKSAELIVADYAKEKARIVENDGVKYAVLEYKTSVVAPTPGVFSLEPVRVKFFIAKRKRSASGELPDLLNDNEIFYDRVIGTGDRLSVELETEAVSLTVVPLPKEGRPYGFKGAVGSFQLAVGVEPAALKTGDATTLTLEVTGEGNFDTVTGIPIPSPEGFRPYEPQITRSPAALKIQQVFRLVDPSADEIPAVTFSFFDPATGAYASITRGPFPLTVQKAAKAAGQPPAPPSAPQQAQKTGEELVTIKERPGPLEPSETGLYYGGAFLLALGALPLIALFGAIVVKRRMDFLASDVEYANWLRMLSCSASDLGRLRRARMTASPKEFYDAVFDIMREYLSVRLLIPAGGITERTIDELLGAKIGDATVLAAIRRVFFDCHLARFTSVELGMEDMKQTEKDVKSVFEYLNDMTYLLKS